MFLQTSKFSVRGAGRVVAAMLVVSLCLSAPAVTAYGAGSSVDVYYMGATGNPVGSYFDGSLTNGAYVATFYGAADTPLDGVTLVNKMPMPDVYMTNQLPGVEYGYAFDADTVDAYYTGASDAPVGSYLPGPQMSGAFVGTYVSATGWTRLGIDGRIVIPALVEGVNPIERKLTVATLENGFAAEVYTHTFRWGFILDAAFDDSAFVLIANNAGNALGGAAILAAYNSNGTLAYIERKPVEIDANTAFALTFDVDLAEYPMGEFSYAVFCWGSDHTPIFPAVKN
ncbi:MAG: hypothetical protein LBK75_02045 [Oscillospiraceae bacterium]|jgi:hypothetical protein|nr:hypothetical protein [Oscillospiraceae bacterium]